MLSAIRNKMHPSVPAIKAGNYLSSQEIPWDLKAVGVARDFVHQLTDPAMFPAYLAGGMAYRLLRWGAVGEWVGASSVKTLSGLFGRQLGASALALGGEVAAFTGAHRAALGLISHASHSKNSLGQEAVGTAVMLGSLRSFGFGAGLVGGILQRAGWGGPGTAWMISQLGAYTGLLTCQQVEHRLLYSDRPADKNPALSAAVALINLNAFGALAREWTPRSWQKLENSLEQKTHRLISEKAEEIRNQWPTDFGIQNPVWQGASVFSQFRPTSNLDPKTQGLQKISSYPEDSTPPPALLKKSWEKIPDDLRGIIHNLFQRLLEGNDHLVQTLAGSQWVDTPRFDLGLRRLNHVVKYAQADTAQSFYINWITLLGFQRILKNGDSAALDHMIEMITQATSRTDYEAFLSRHLPEGTFSIKSLSEQWTKTPHPQRPGIESLPLGPQAKKNLELWLFNQSKETAHTPFFIPQQSFLANLEYLSKMDIEKWGVAQAVIERSGALPLGRLRLYRLFQILQSEIVWDKKRQDYVMRGWLGTKLRELVDDKFRTAEEFPGRTTNADLFAYGAKGGYLGYHGPDKLLRPMLEEIRHLVDPKTQQARREKRNNVLGKFLEDYSGESAFEQEYVAEAFSRLSEAFKGENWEFEHNGETGDFSHHIAKDLRGNDFNLEIHTETSFKKRFLEIMAAYGKHKNHPFQEIKKIPQGKMIYSHGSFEIPGSGKKPLMLIILPDQEIYLTPEDRYFEVMVTAVHEWRHLKERLEYTRGGPRIYNESADLKQEAASHTTHNWFQAQGGEVEEMRSFATEGLGGYMMRYLDYIEAKYRENWQD